MTRIGVLVVHGMGRQKQGYSEGLRTALLDRLGPDAWRLEWKEVLWAPILEPRETDLWDAMARATTPAGVPIRLDQTAIRGFVLHNFGDATAYQRHADVESAGQLIHQRVSNAIEDLQTALADPAAPVVVVAHSLGGHIMSNYIWDRQHGAQPSAVLPQWPIPTLAGLITFGCNIPLFALAFRDAKPINLPGEAVSNPEVRDAVRWLNFLDQDDVLGWPLRPLYLKDADGLNDAQRVTVSKLEDYEINVGGLLTGWNPASHDGYWEDDDFVQPVAEYFAQLLAAIDA
jgi:hypothetical protein